VGFTAGIHHGQAKLKVLGGERPGFGNCAAKIKAPILILQNLNSIRKSSAIGGFWMVPVGVDFRPAGGCEVNGTIGCFVDSGGQGVVRRDIQGRIHFDREGFLLELAETVCHPDGDGVSVRLVEPAFKATGKAVYRHPIRNRGNQAPLVGLGAPRCLKTWDQIGRITLDQAHGNFLGLDDHGADHGHRAVLGNNIPAVIGDLDRKLQICGIGTGDDRRADDAVALQLQPIWSGRAFHETSGSLP
jgi:hypothetical protein